MLVNSPSDFDYLEIGLASPDRIRYWSYGEVEKPETINYRTFKPERRGLFCEKIFGPVKDWECSCGKYRRVRYRGIVCERCGVEVTHSKVRRERMGHLELAADVCHIWFLKGIPSYIGLLLDMSSRQLEEVIYYDSYIITEVDDSVALDLSVGQTLSSTEYVKAREKFGDSFKSGMGASAIKTLLGQLDLKKIAKELRESLTEIKGQKRLKATKRLRVVESFIKSGNSPTWMILEAIPVMPPDLRPMVQLEGGRFATSDLNDLYRRVVNRNNRLKRLIDIGAPEMIVRNEKRMLQEAVDVLISNGKRGRSVTGSNGRPLKSLGNIIEGKQGRFRQNLLGKRVDYSARSVIVVGPHLQFHQCGLPKEMALELFKPFVIRKLVERAHASNVKSAKRKIEKREVIVWDVLEEVIQGQPVLLNRAPTLHRLGIQAFEPKLVEGSAIQIHPLVCTAFNADFDGDQMAVHVPLSLEAQAECRLLIMANNNILSPSSGRSIVTPTQDMILGCYFMTVLNEEEQLGKGKYFANVDEAMRAWETGAVGFQSEITVRIEGARYTTTIGRVIFNTTIWNVFKEYGMEHQEEYVNEIIGKKQLSQLVFRWYGLYGNDVLSRLVNVTKNMGFKYATLSGISIGIDDLKIPSNKPELLDKAKKEVDRLVDLEKKGVILPREKENRSLEIWRETTQLVANSLSDQLGSLNNVFIMANSGARGNMDQVRQLAGMRGLMSDSQGRTVNIPIKTSFKEGLSLTEYFISSYGARKGLVDTALRTADSGYLTRRLVDVAQDVMITQENCMTEEGVDIEPIKDGINVIVSLGEIVEGRVTLEDVIDPDTKEVITAAGEMITYEQAQRIGKLDLTSLRVRSIYRCKAPRGVCQRCYGMDLSTGKLINIGEAIGIIAAQSIGEPGTQLTMRTFHTGGVDLRKASRVEILSDVSGKFSMKDDLGLSKVKDEDGNEIWISTREGLVEVGSGKDKRVYTVPQGSSVSLKSGVSLKKGDVIADYDPSFEYVVSESEGVVKFFGFSLQDRKDADGKTVEHIADKDGEIFIYDPAIKNTYEVVESVAKEFKEGQRVRADEDSLSSLKLEVGGLVVKLKKTTKTKGKDQTPIYEISISPGDAYHVFSGASVFAEDGSKAKSGEVLARERLGSADASKTKDIVQGLPRVEELFEARKPKDSAVLTEVDGTVEISNHESYRLISVSSADGKKDYKVPYGVRLQVYSGKSVRCGDQLTHGVINPHDILLTQGVVATQIYLTNEVQRVYRSQGVQINSKHIEVIVRQMTRKTSITEMGDSSFLPNELIDIRRFRDVNGELEAAGKEIAEGKRVLLGITRASLNTESFISASSFQQTASVLTKAAIEGQIDPMYGLKENVIIGKLIPAGTGMSLYDRVGLDMAEQDSAEEDLLAQGDEAIEQLLGA